MNELILFAVLAGQVDMLFRSRPRLASSHRSPSRCRAHLVDHLHAFPIVLFLQLVSRFIARLDEIGLVITASHGHWSNTDRHGLAGKGSW